MDWSVLPLLAAIYLLVVALNVVPAFMPATWTVLAFFEVRYRVPLLPLTIGGALSATAGRILLARFSGLFGRRFLSAETHRRLDALRRFVRRRRHMSFLGVLFFAFGPIPSNQLFITAGLARVKLKLVSAAFLAGRLVSYTALVYATQKSYERIEEILFSHLSNTTAMIVQVVGLLVLGLLVKIDWTKVLRRFGGSGAP
ncbi:MAG: hypothetical protein HY331_08510 [Chloroflexi bacterium]|nr:hypothetical protein [Chloroflexota bacterium]